MKIVPTLLAISETKVIAIANRAVLQAIHSHVDTLLENKELLSFHTDPNGKLLYTQTNAACITEIQSEVLALLQNTVNDLQRFGLHIPLGQILGSRIFATKGPTIKVAMCPYGYVDVKILDRFDVTGINQLKYDLFLNASFTLQIVIPLISTKTYVSVDVPLTTVIIPGEVPDTYLTLPYDNQ